MMMESYVVLIVEDDLLVAKSIQKNLAELGYQAPVSVASGEEALQKLEELRTHL